jgi:hypothetical protein
MPLNYARRFGEDFAWYYRNGMRASDFCALKGQFATQGLNLYVLARLHNAPGKEVDAIMEEYYAGFGAASEAVRAYFEYLEEVDLGVTNEHFRQAVAQRATEKMPLSPRWATWLYYHRVADLIYTGEVFDRAFELLRRARERAGGDETLLAKIDYLAKGLENSRLTAAIGPVYDHYLRTGEKEPLRHTSERLDAYRATIEPALTGNMGMVYFAESMTWRPVLAEEADE